MKATWTPKASMLFPEGETILDAVTDLLFAPKEEVNTENSALKSETKSQIRPGQSVVVRKCQP